MNPAFDSQRDRRVAILPTLHPELPATEPDPIEDPDLDRPVRHPDGTFTRDLTRAEIGFVGLCLTFLLAAAAIFGGA